MNFQINNLKKKLNIAAVVWILVLYLVFMPAINVHSLGFWHYVLYAVMPLLIINLHFSVDIKSMIKDVRNKTIIGIIGVLVVIILLADVVGTPLFGGLNAYRNRISVPESSEFTSIGEFDKSQVQIIDKEVSESLADRVFGELGADVVSQYQMSDNYSSVVVNGTMYRLTPVEYSSLIKWISTSRGGTPGFISVNVTDGTTEFHELEKGLKYTQNSFFLHKLSTHLRLTHPTCIFGYTRFEVDDNWNPYWVSQVMSYKFIGKAPDVKGVVITDPITGESKYYDKEEVPSWVDNVYDAPLISEQYYSYGKYINGLFNFSQKGVTSVTNDYAYLQKDGHLWMYTGVTSVGNDESNVGFIYVDLQDKEMIYVISAGAEEYSARASAEGAVQEKGYFAVFPTMVNVNGQPVYFMGLKDNAGLIKAYAFVSYKNYQQVGVGTTVEEALKNYSGKNIVDESQRKETKIIVNDVASAVVEGYTIYYIKDTSGNIYHCSIEINDNLPFIKVGDEINVTISGNEILYFE